MFCCQGRGPEPCITEGNHYCLTRQCKVGPNRIIRFVYALFETYVSGRVGCFQIVYGSFSSFPRAGITGMHCHTGLSPTASWGRPGPQELAIRLASALTSIGARMILHAYRLPRETGPPCGHKGPRLCQKKPLLKVFGSQTPDRPLHPLRLWSRCLLRSSGSEATTQGNTDTHMLSRCRPHRTAKAHREAERLVVQHDQNKEKHETQWQQLATGTWRQTPRPQKLASYGPRCAAFKQNYWFLWLKKNQQNHPPKAPKRTFNGRTQFYDTLNKDKRW